LQVDRAGAAALVGLELVGDALVLVEAVHPGLLDRADMDEGVLAAILGRDEAVALLGVEKFDLADGHDALPCSWAGPEWPFAVPGKPREGRRSRKAPKTVRCDRSRAAIPTAGRNGKCGAGQRRPLLAKHGAPPDSR